MNRKDLCRTQQTCRATQCCVAAPGQRLAFGKSRILHLMLKGFVGLLLILSPCAVCAQSEFARRLPDDRPQLNPDQLSRAGLRVLRSKHLVLVTDIPAVDVAGLPQLADSLYLQLCRELGTPAAAADDAAFQVTGYLMDAPERFGDAGLLPPQRYVIRHGRHLGYQFWMRNQTTDYYRRHLLLHEFVHCFMMCETGMRDIPPLWFTEGIAEYYATHEQQPFRAGIVPARQQGFEGWGRIGELTEQLRQEGSEILLRDVLKPNRRIFESELHYAQGWAMYWLIRTHPELRDEFQLLTGVRSRGQFDRAVARLSPQTIARMQIVWLLVLDSLTEGFDVDRSFPELDPPWREWTAGEDRQLNVRADRGWQPSGVSSSTAMSIKIVAEARCILRQEGGDWVSEPQGITIDYVAGSPLGELQAMAVPREPASAPQRLRIGRQSTISIPANSELWLRINDLESSRAENSGGYRVQLTAVEE